MIPLGIFGSNQVTVMVLLTLESSVNIMLNGDEDATSSIKEMIKNLININLYLHHQLPYSTQIPLLLLIHTTI